MDHLLQCFRSPTLGWLTIGYLVASSIGAFLWRVAKAVQGPFDRPSRLNPIANLFWLCSFGCLIATLVSDWRYGLAMAATGLLLFVADGFVKLGGLLLLPICRITELDEDHPLNYSEPFIRDVHMRRETADFVAAMVLAIGGYALVSWLLNLVRKEADLVFLWTLIVLQMLLYIRVFWVSGARLRRYWYHPLIIPLPAAFLGRIAGLDYYLMAFIAVFTTAAPYRIARLVRSREGQELPPQGEQQEEPEE